MGKIDTYDEIWPNLYVGGISSVSEASSDQFDMVLSVCQDTRDENVGCVYDHVALADDDEAERNWGGDSSYEAFAEAVATLFAHLIDGQTVLVHCHSGQNRSVSVAVAAMCLYEKHQLGLDFDADFMLRHIQIQRPVADPDEKMWSHVERMVGGE